MDEFQLSQRVEALQTIAAHYDQQLRDINAKIFLNPEIAFEEHQAHNNICNLFEGPGFEDYQVTRHAYGMDTSFKVEFGSGGRLVIFNAEYDAIPGLKHACGHNLIATGSIAAFIMTCEYLRKSASKETYRVQLLGTPAEEDGGGKIVLLNAGAYEGVDACLMAHPVPVIDQAPEIDGGAAPGGYMARAHVQVTFSGKPAQAAARAWDGINALDAAVAAYLNVSLLRQQLPPDQRINGIILNGGQRANVVPELTSMEYYMRAPSMGSLKKLQTAAIGCFEAACKSTGCRVDFKWFDTYESLKYNRPICDMFIAAMRALGKNVLFDTSNVEGSIHGASTDMGNVTHIVPGFHGNFHIPADGYPHTHAFVSAAGSSEGHDGAVNYAIGMSTVACQILMNTEFAMAVQKDFKERGDDV